MSVGLFIFDVQSMKTQVTTWGIGIQELWTVSGLIFRKSGQFSEIITKFDATHCQDLVPFRRQVSGVSGGRLGAR